MIIASIVTFIHATFKRFAFGILAVSLLTGCGPRQLSETTSSLGELPVSSASECQQGWTPGLLRSLSPTMRSQVVPRELLHARPRHAAGDVVRLDIVEGEEFSGTYKVNMDGHLTVPYAGSIRAAGLTTPGLTDNIKRIFVDKGLLLGARANLSVIPVEWAPVQIRVTGAVFQPGRSLINPPERTGLQQQTPPIGDSPLGRFLDAGLRTAVGVRPDADMSRIKLYRGGRKFTIDLTGIIEDTPVPDIYLMHGDHVEVPSTDCNQEALMRPSQVTPANIRVFISNVSVPVTGTPEQFATQVPYGTRLLTAAVSGNCVGGTHLTNASRRIAHIAHSPMDGKAIVNEIPVRDMLEQPNDFVINPYLMPNDAIACYDSGMTNLREAVRVINETLSAVGLALVLF
jgi:polysaccharide export outer membrane protein